MSMSIENFKVLLDGEALNLPALKIVQIVAEAIREAKRIPSGYLYSSLMTFGISLDSYNSIIATLVRAGVIKVVHHEIIWIKKEKA